MAYDPENKATFDFGEAIKRLKSGARVARTGWNGKGMWLFLARPDDAIGANAYQHEPRLRLPRQTGAGGWSNCLDVLPSICMKTANNEIQPGWTASQPDMFAEDWVEINSD